MSIHTPSDSSEFTLTIWDASEIVQILQKLGASEQVMFRANASFQFRKIPWSKIGKILWGFKIGDSLLPEVWEWAMEIQSHVAKLTSWIIAANNDKFSIAA